MAALRTTAGKLSSPPGFWGYMQYVHRRLKKIQLLMRCPCCRPVPPPGSKPPQGALCAPSPKAFPPAPPAVRAHDRHYRTPTLRAKKTYWTCRLAPAIYPDNTSSHGTPGGVRAWRPCLIHNGKGRRSAWRFTQAPKERKRAGHPSDFRQSSRSEQIASL